MGEGGVRLPALMPMLIAAGMAGCAPTLDWREVRPAGTAAVALLPCKPNSSARTVALAGHEMRLAMLVCKAGEWTWALASADVGQPQRVGMVLQALRDSVQANVQGRLLAGAPANVPGATPNAASMHASFAGRRPDGSEVHARVLVFAHGTQVFEAVVMGGTPPAGAAQPFFESLRVRP